MPSSDILTPRTWFQRAVGKLVDVLNNVRQYCYEMSSNRIAYPGPSGNDRLFCLASNRVVKKVVIP